MSDLWTNIIKNNIKIVKMFCQSNTFDVQKALLTAVQNGHVFLARYFIKEHNADATIEIEAENLLLLALKNSDLRMFSLLVDNGADVFGPIGVLDENILMVAIEEGKNDISVYLIEKFGLTLCIHCDNLGKNSFFKSINLEQFDIANKMLSLTDDKKFIRDKFFLNKRDNQVNTILHHVCYHENNSALKYLLNIGVDEDIKNHSELKASSYYDYSHLKFKIDSKIQVIDLSVF